MIILRYLYSGRVTAFVLYLETGVYEFVIIMSCTVWYVAKMPGISCAIGHLGFDVRINRKSTALNQIGPQLSWIFDIKYRLNKLAVSEGDLVRGVLEKSPEIRYL